MKARNVLWWAAFFYVGIALQNALPGVDVLVVGLLVALREKNLGQLAWLIPLLILVQEGGGPVSFGSAMLWYALVIVLFFISRNIFVVQNIVFMFMFSSGLSLVRFVTLHFMYILQTTPLDAPRFLDECILQALLIPPGMWLASLSRKFMVFSDESES